MTRFMKVLMIICITAVLSVFSTAYAEGEPSGSPSDSYGEEIAADKVTVNTIRINNVGAVLKVFIAGAVGDSVSISLFKPGVEISDSSADYSAFLEGVAYVEMLNLDETGEFTFSYTAEDVGMYTLRVRGAVFEYTTENNDVLEEKSDKMYLEAWVNDESAYTYDDFHAKVTLSKKIINSFGMEVTAKSIKNKLDARPVGRRNLFVANDLLPHTKAENYVYWDNGVAETQKILGEFLAEYYSIGGKLDAVYTDAEATTGMWHLGNMANNLGISTNEITSAISSDKRYLTELKPQLIAAGYNEADDNGTELSSIYRTSDSNNYHYFNILMQRRAAEYLTEAVYGTAINYFPNVKYCEYGFSDLKQWQGPMDSIHKSYIGGNEMKAGTHSSPVLYGGRSFYITRRFANLGDETEEYTVKTPNTDFGEVLGTVIQLRKNAASGKNVNIMPWISVPTNEDFIDSGYYYEKIFHTGMHNPDPFLFFGPDSDPTPALAAIDELNKLVAFPGRKSLNAEQVRIESDTKPDSSASKSGYVVASKTPIINTKYVLSGMYAGGRNIWRITPDTSVVSSEEFLVSSNPPVFKVGDETVTFENGEILSRANSISDIGYWVVTPEGTVPKISYDVEKQSFAASIDFHDVNVGKKLDDVNGAEIFDAVVTYRNCYDDNVKFIMAKYDGNNVLTGIEIKECAVFNPEGHAAIFNVTNLKQAEKIRFFLWSDLQPLTEVYGMTE